MQPPHTANLPLQTSARLPAVDMLRGLALLGIGIENLFAIHSPNAVFADYAAQYPDGLNHWLITGLMILVRGKFYPIFSLVFGISFAFSLAHVGVTYFIRRLGVFFLLGLLQVFFVWTGDVLMQYAFLGLLLVLCRKIPVKILFPLSALLLLVSFLGDGFLPTNNPATAAAEVYQTGSFWKITVARGTDYAQSFFSRAAPFFYAKIFAFMLLGFALAKSGLLLKLQQKSLAVKAMAAHAALVLVIGSWFVFAGWRNQDQGTSGNWLREVLLAGYFYGLVACYALLPFLFSKVWEPLRQLGQFTLTHYLVQNVLFSILMYGYGFRLMGTLSPVNLLLLYAGVVALLWVATQVWAAKFKQGPMEALVRKLAGRKS